MKGQLVDAGVEALAGEERRVVRPSALVIAAAISARAAAVDEVQLDRHAGGRRAARGVEHVSRELSPFSVVSLRPRQPYGGRASV